MKTTKQIKTLAQQYGVAIVDLDVSASKEVMTAHVLVEDHAYRIEDFSGTYEILTMAGDIIGHEGSWAGAFAAISQ